MTNYTPEIIRQIFHSINVGIGNHGSFLTNLADTVVSADGDNFNILRPALEEIIEKYDLNKKPYIEDTENIIEKAEQILPGQEWENMIDLDNPFRRRWSVKITNVKNGWINYSFGSVFDNESMEEKIFRQVYKLKK